MPTSLTPVTLTTAHLTLRPWQRSDADEIFRLCQDPDIQRWTSVPSPFARADATGFLDRVVDASWADGSGAQFAVCDRRDGALLASIALMWRHGDPDIAELGYWCGAEARGRGVTVEAGRALCRWGFDTAGPRRIEWLAAVGNEASWRVAHQIGFRFEGRLHARLADGAGSAVDAWSAGLVPGEVASERVPLPFGSDPVLRDGPVTVRRWRAADVPAYAALQSDPQVLAWNGRPPSALMSEARAAYEINEAQVERWMTGTGAAFAIECGGEVVGGIGLVRRHGRLGELGWWLGRSRGQGIATRGVRLVAGWAPTVGLDRLEARVHVDNERSQALAERAGLRREGRLSGEAPYLVAATGVGPAYEGWGDAFTYGLLTAAP